MLETKKIKEWRQWGKDAFRDVLRAENKRGTKPEDIEEIHKNYGYSWLLTGHKKDDLKLRFEYTEEDCQQAYSSFKEGYNAGKKWYKTNLPRHQAVMDKYNPILKEAEEFAKTIDVSDIEDGFPCGSAFLYVQECGEMEDLRKAIAFFQLGSGGRVEHWKYKLPLKMPSYGQCIDFDKRICDKVQEFLFRRGIIVNRYSYID